MRRLIGALAVGCVVALLPAAAATANPPPGLGGTITAKADGAVIAGACVTLFDGAQVEKGSGCTDSAGRYQITGIPAANYKVRIKAPGFAELWAYDEPDFLNAEWVWVPDTEQRVLDLGLRRGAGTIRGTVTNNGKPVYDNTVEVHRIDRSRSVIAYTDANGRYAIPNMPPGDYKVSFSDNVRGYQWAHGKETFEEANTFTITDGQDTVVDEQLLPLGTVEATVLDEVTGQPVREGCIQIQAGQQPEVCTSTGGKITARDVPPGTHSISVRAVGTHWPKQASVTVTRGGLTTLTASLQPAASIFTTVKDRVTKAPAEACVRLIHPKSGVSTHMSEFCSSADGRLVIGPLYPDTVQLLARPTDGVHGMQWVGFFGGTGEQSLARQVTTKVGSPVNLPSILLDGAGTITGTITDKATGAPVGGVCAYPYHHNPNQGGSTGPHCSTSDGRYQVTGLGPYAWPLMYVNYKGYGWQWSGGAADRSGAKGIRVTNGGSATANETLVPEGKIAGVVRNAQGQPVWGFLEFYNAKSGDYLGYANASNDGKYTFGRMITQDVKIRFRAENGTMHWHPSAVRVTSGQTVTLDLQAPA